jgi:catechol 2,3-dioxygenase-like lactoylglutathione lyase family enzyme
VDFNHVNLAVGNGRFEEEEDFLVNVIGLRKLERPPNLDGPLRQYAFPTGGEIHLADDEGFVPSTKCHVAIDVGDDLPAIVTRLEAAGIEVKVLTTDGRRFAVDPAGWLWELRPAASPWLTQGSVTDPGSNQRTETR